MRRLPCLDGIRAVSIALVLAGHTLPFSARKSVGDLANLGVRSFFVLSGFLITTLLLKEFEGNGRISLRRFYARRTLRIFPAFYVYLLVIFAAELIGLVPRIDRQSWIYAVTYTIDYLPIGDRAWNLGHLWSLAVEEQFYLVWPTLLVLLRPRKALWAALAVVAVVPVVRWATWRYFPANADGIKWQFHTVCDALATGCLLAGLRDAAWARPAWRRWIGSRLFFVVPLGVLALGRLVVGRPQVSYLAGQTLMNVGIALCVERLLRHPDGPVGRFLELRSVAYAGVLSYSIYLWQQPFFNREAQGWIFRLPASLLATVALAWLSYTFVERPFLGLRKYFEAPGAAPRAGARLV